MPDLSNLLTPVIPQFWEVKGPTIHVVSTWVKAQGTQSESHSESCRFSVHSVLRICPLVPAVGYTLTQADIISHLDPCGHPPPQCLALCQRPCPPSTVLPKRHSK